MDAKWVALGLFGFSAFQMGADPEGTQAGIASFFTSSNAVVKQVPTLFNTDGIGTGGTSPTPGTAGPGMQVVTLSDGREVQVPVGYRIVPTGS